MAKKEDMIEAAKKTAKKVAVKAAAAALDVAEAVVNKAAEALEDAQEAPKAEAPKAQKAKASAKAALHTDLGKYTSVIPKSENVQIVPGKAKYALFPVWLLNTSYHGKTYTFAMNGQTGRFIGNLPISKSKLAGLFVGVAAGVSAVTFLAGLLAGLF